MYFSLITPAQGCEREAAQQRLNGPYSDHQWLWRLFPAPAGTLRDFLFRRQQMDGMPRFYVLSRRKPEPLDDAWEMQTREYAPQVSAGATLRFDLRASPTVRHGRDGKSKRHDVVMEAKKKLLADRGPSADGNDHMRPALYSIVQESCSAWLARRGESMGFAVDPASLVIQGYEQHDQPTDRKLRFSTVDFSGELTVTDAAGFSATLIQGIGPAKAFGCGLLLVRRVG